MTNKPTPPASGGAQEPADDTREAFGKIDGIGASYIRETDSWRLYTMPGAVGFASVDGFNRRRLDWIVAALRAALKRSPAESGTELDDSGEAMVCTGCGTTRTVAAIRKSSATAFTCCPERKMIPVRHMWDAYGREQRGVTLVKRMDDYSGEHREWFEEVVLPSPAESGGAQATAADVEALRSASEVFDEDSAEFAAIQGAIVVALAASPHGGGR